MKQSNTNKIKQNKKKHTKKYNKSILIDEKGTFYYFKNETLQAKMDDLNVLRRKNYSKIPFDSNLYAIVNVRGCATKIAVNDDWFSCFLSLNCD